MRFHAALKRRLDTATRGDSGFTMLEVVVVLVIMSIVLIIFTTGIQQAFSAETHVDSASSADAQLVIAFQKLDKEIRYAAGISSPGTSNGDPVVEFLTSFTGTSTCTEVRLHASTLQQRTWTQGSNPLIPGTWQQMAANASATTPFTVTWPNATYQFERLNIALSVTYGSNKTASTKQTNITFTALNTTSTTSATNTGTVCTEGRGTAW